MPEIKPIFKAEGQTHYDGVSLYIHWPFCLSKCPYCDFNSHLIDKSDPKDWERALLAELDNQIDLYCEQNALTNGPNLKSIFFGGGTPSLMPTSVMVALIDRAVHRCSVQADLEITAEANPTSAEAQKIKSFALAGVNRLSLGIQSLSAKGLAFLGREHSATEALLALDIAQKTMKHVSADIIYGLPDQSIDEWQGQLEQLLNRSLTHISAYQLTIEPGTIFHTRSRKGEVLTAPSDHVAELYLITEQLCKTAGLHAYEVSNYAQKGKECRHNICYWTSGDWLAVGPGGHSQYTTETGRLHSENRKSPSGWMEDVFKHGHSRLHATYLTPDEIFQNYWMMGLRLAQGISYPRDIPSISSFELNQKWLTIFCEEGWIEQNDNGIRPTLEGRLRLNGIVSRLLEQEE